METGTLFIAPLGARNNKDQVFMEILSQCPNNDYSSILYVGPNNFVLSTARSLFYSFLKKTFGQSAYIPFQTVTIKKLAADLYERLSDKILISEHMRTFILCEMLGENSIGYARILSDLLKKFRHYLPDTPLSRIQDDVRRLIFEEKAAERAVRAVEVLKSYEVRLRGKNICDPDDMLRKSVSFISEHMSPAVLIIDGFYDPTRLELQIISALSDKAEKVYILAEEETEILEHLQSQQLNLETKKLKCSFQRKKTGYYSFPSMEEEVEGIARNIKKLIIEGINPWEITICFPEPGKYLSMTRRVFKRHGIPLSIGEYNVSSRGPIVALDEMITCVEEDYPRNEFLSLLTSPFFPSVPVVVKERAVSYSYKAGIVKGKTSWLSIKDILLNTIQNNISEKEKGHLDTFQKALKHVIDIIDGVKARKDMSSFVDAMESALDRLGFFDSLSSTQFTAEGDSISELFSKQLSELHHFAGIYGPGYKSVESPAFYLKYLLQSMTGSEENRDGVRMLPYVLAAGCESKALFFGGMLEGDFPSRPDIDPILPEKVKKALNIPHIEYYLKRQRAYFRRLLHISLLDPWFSCPSAEGDKVFLASPYLDWEEIQNAPDLNMYTEEDVLIRSGAAQHAGREATFFLGERLFPTGTSLGILNQRINALFRGFVSVTAIDYYRKCPLRFYIEKVLGLDVEVPPRFEVQSRLWGTLAHTVMEYVFKDGDIELASMEKKIAQGLDTGLKQFPIGDFWSRVAKEIFQKLLALLKGIEEEIRTQRFSPCMVEKNITADVDGLKLKGKIDRIDRKLNPAHNGAGTGNDGSRTTVALLDYKTGTIDIESLQLPLYACMWKVNFSEPVEKTGYYSLKEGRVHWFPKKKGMDEFMHDALKKAESIVRDIKKGVFSPEPVKAGECRYCSHSSLCRSA